MKKYILKLLCALYSIMFFLPNVMADSIDDFYKSFIEVTTKYKPCDSSDSLKELERIEKVLELGIVKLFFKGDKPRMKEYKQNYPKEYITQFIKLIMNDKNNPKKILNCRFFSYYLFTKLTNLKIRNWILVVPPTKPGARDGHMANVYVNPRDNNLYLADGNTIFKASENCMILDPSFFAHVPIDDYFRDLKLDKRKCEYVDMDKNARESTPYDKFIEEYQKYIKERTKI